ncbi:hypothetical protein [Allocoleopsis franciscana]|uniref:hypothetical protein n=1 Tax=Allocoleopsis franciscana TaxID=2886352 RepID=UPI0002E9F3AE|nr:hypothetical protein [Allocoleopsis franciscana]
MELTRGDDRGRGGSWTTLTGCKSEVFEGWSGVGIGIINTIAWSARDIQRGRWCEGLNRVGWCFNANAGTGRIDRMAGQS